VYTLPAYVSQFRLRTNLWIGYHLLGDYNSSLGYLTQGYTISTDGKTYPLAGNIVADVYAYRTDYPGFGLDYNDLIPFTVGGLTYTLQGDARVSCSYSANEQWLAVAQLAKNPQGYAVTFVMPVWRLLHYTGPFPLQTYLQDVKVLVQDGICLTYPLRGDPGAGAQVVGGVGGILDNGASPWQCLDLGACYLNDAVGLISANVARPIGVAAVAVSGTVTISAFDALPHQRYSLYRDSTWVKDFTGLSTTDAPSAGAHTYYLTSRDRPSAHGTALESAPGATLQVTV
jgi:hypothetical protein